MNLNIKSDAHVAALSKKSGKSLDFFALRDIINTKYVQKPKRLLCHCIDGIGVKRGGITKSNTCGSKNRRTVTGGA